MCIPAQDSVLKAMGSHWKVLHTGHDEQVVSRDGPGYHGRIGLKEQVERQGGHAMAIVLKWALDRPT